MKETEGDKRGKLIRESLVFQVKLIADGMRDFALVPVSIVATIIGVIRGGDTPDREFQRVIELGRRSEQWINLFGQHEPIKEAGRAGSIDMLLTQAEDVVREQVKEGGLTEPASRAITKALTAAHEKVRGEDWDNDNREEDRDRGVDI
jgi:hypothetical protein